MPSQASTLKPNRHTKRLSNDGTNSSRNSPKTKTPSHNAITVAPNIEYTVYKPLDDEIKHAKKLAADGTLYKVTKSYLNLAQRYGDTLKRHNYDVLRSNRDSCLDAAGHAAIRHVDKLIKQKFFDAVSCYRLVIEFYQKIHQRIGEEKYANKIQCATEKNTYVRQNLWVRST